VVGVAATGATPPRLARVDLRTDRITRSRDIVLRGNGEFSDCRISGDESTVVIQYLGYRARLELMRGIRADR